MADHELAQPDPQLLDAVAGLAGVDRVLVVDETLGGESRLAVAAGDDELAYGVFIAGAVASMFGDPVRQKLTLGGDGGGIFDLDSHGDAVTLTVTRVATAGPPAAQVTDALAGRAPTSAVLGDLPARTRTALWHLADFFNIPVEQRPARPGPPRSLDECERRLS